jgi:hypothetical protein
VSESIVQVKLTIRWKTTKDLEAAVDELLRHTAKFRTLPGHLP